MARNGSGTFNRLYDWTDERDAGNNIDATKMDAEMDGMATALTESIAKDGQTTPTADLPMGGFKHTGVGAASARTHYPRLDQVQDGKLAWVDSGGTADAITAAYSPAITTLVDGQLCYVRAGAANATTTPTFSPNGLTARTIVKEGGTALVAGDIVGDGHELVLRYDLSNTRWELLNPSNTTAITTALAAKQADVVTTRGDLVRGDSSGDAERLAVGTSGQILGSDGTDAAWADRQTIGTPDDATGSPSTITFTGIPAWVKRFSLNIDRMSTSGTSVPIVQIGDAGGLENSGYLGSAGMSGASSYATAQYTTGLGLAQAWAADRVLQGTVVFELIESSSNTWEMTFTGGRSDTASVVTAAARKPLSAALDRVAITTVGGSDTFDGDTLINIEY